MRGNEILRIVDAIHRDKNIDKEIVFEGIEQAILSAARKHFGEDHDLTVTIDRDTGEPSLQCDGSDLEPEVLGDILGRIAAQTAKQVMIQKIREAERDALYEEYSALRGQCVTGTVSRVDRDSQTATVNIGKIEAILPRGEQIPGETHRPGERVRAVIIEVRKTGSRVKVILSRTHPELVLRLFEMEIPEVAEGVIEIRSLAREAGYRSKVAVSCNDPKVDCVGACVGVRGSRIKTIVDELHGERIDIVRWNDSLQVLVPNAMQPAEVEDVILCPMLGRVIVLVREDQLSLAIGKRGQNVRLASKLVGWDIEVMTREELDEQLDRSVEAFASIPGVSEELAENLVAQGFFSFYDLSVIEPEHLAELGGLTPEECDRIIEYADQESMRQEEEEERRQKEAKEAKTEREPSRPVAPAVATGTAETAEASADATAPDESGPTVTAAPGEAAESAGEAGEVASEGATAAQPAPVGAATEESGAEESGQDEAEPLQAQVEPAEGDVAEAETAAEAAEVEAAQDDPGSEMVETAEEVPAQADLEQTETAETEPAEIAEAESADKGPSPAIQSDASGIEAAPPASPPVPEDRQAAQLASESEATAGANGTETGDSEAAGIEPGGSEAERTTSEAPGDSLPEPSAEETDEADASPATASAEARTSSVRSDEPVS
ncbi:MAG: transcription termination factor NusA, partial [Planctomycetes bacterium]|nr:transcription termination factor NusA [Planctomycetota bacterium]